MLEIPFLQLIVGVRYTFLWGPYRIPLSGICVSNTNKNVIADFNTSYHENGSVANEDGITASAGPFFQM